MRNKPPNPVLVEAVERALEPLKKVLSPEMIEHFREEALVLFEAHPYTAALIRQLSPDPIVHKSGSQPTSDGDLDEPSPALTNGRSRGGDR